LQSKIPQDDYRCGEEFWDRLGAVMGNERPFAWAARIGIPKSTFSHCMNCKMILPLKHLLKIVEVTGISLKWLITGEKGGREGPARPLTEDKVLGELLEIARKLPAAKREMVRDIVKRIAEEE